MGLYIKGMEMPKNCDRCFIKPGYCPAIINRMKSDVPGYTWIPANYRHEDCPLVEVPSHGRLIDADAFDGVICNQADLQNQAADYHYDNCDCGFIDGLIFTRSRIRNAPTVIPASEEVET